MDALLQPSATKRESEWRPKLAGIAAVVMVAGFAAFLLRSKPSPPVVVNPYTAKLTISDLKMSQAQNFVGASVTYVDGTLTNNGEKTVIHAVVRVTFKDPYGQVAQIEKVPIKVLQTSGPYPDTADLAVSPVAAGQSEPFRLIFEHISEQWNQAYPELQIVDVKVK